MYYNITNTVGPSRNNYTFLSIRKAWYNFTCTERFYGNLMSLANNKSWLLRSSCKIPETFARFSSADFHNIPNFKFHLNLSSGCRANTEDIQRQTDRQTDSLISCHSKRALLWPFNVACVNKNVHSLEAKFPIFLSDFNHICISSTDFHKIFQFHWNPPSGRRLMHAEKQTDKEVDGWVWRRLKGAFADYAKAPRLTCTKTIWRCMHHASSYNMYIKQQDAQNSCD